MARPSTRSIRKIFQERTPAASGRKQGFSLSFSWPVIGAMGLVLLCAIAWSFFMGFMVGRGQNPETRLREMAGMKTERMEDTEPRDALPQDSSAALSQSEMAAESESAPAPPAPAPGPPAEEKKPDFRVPEGAALSAWGHSALPREDQAAEAKKPPKPPIKANPEPQYDYSFQLGAFKNQKDAEKLKKTLAASGIGCKIQKSGKVYLLITSLRGDAAAEKSLRQKMKSRKLGEPLLLSRKTVAPKTKKGK